MSRQQWLKRLPAILGVSAIVLALCLGFFLKQWLFKDDVQTKKMVQQITIIAPPPPPPPPPPPEIKEPEVEEELEEPPEEALPDDSNEPAPGEDLGVDADGEAGGDGFGLVAKRGGSGLLGGGGYEQFVREEINEYILDHPRLKYQEYVAVITLWIADSGEFERYEIELRNGNEEVRTMLEELLAQKSGLSRPRPLEASSQVTLRIKSVL